ncbi:PP2C family protein-serine/threonine phosphatase [Kitasatospora aureofaciens]|uniref:PP2C family protein-serine/threonine phosphatase n=1 Tax=Kitasatospora aureofaciens TaxID=1894 RepID=UPI001C44A850|nr:PP2C family protein-serine/threonine phosphatase [Kitasatospora aureofaciens]MBV6701419.1 serine/threonine-protein phosphatase [Kitasatospora aureofaciens]
MPALIARVRRWYRRLLDGDARAGRDTLVVLLALTVVLGLLPIVLPYSWPPSALVLPLVVGGLVLPRGRLLVLVCAALAGSVLGAVMQDPVGVRLGVTVVLAATGATVLVANRFRHRLGLRGTQGDSMLLELAEHTRTLARLPDRLLDWHFDSALAPAGGASFSGDFLLCAHRPEDDLLELLLVDVSGKGSRAAARSTHLSGAFAMLLGRVPPEAFLPAANDHLVRMGWEDHFATAVHLALRPATGEYRLFNAGHPQPVQYQRADDAWELSGPGGPALGLLPGAPYPGTTGRLAHGDSLLLFSDGLVEVPGRDLDEGVVRLLAAAEPEVRTPRTQQELTRGAAERLVRTVARNVSDDRTLVLVRRVGTPG